MRKSLVFTYKWINEIPRKKGCYISKDQEETEIEMVEERTESEINGNWIENETVNVWKKEDLKEFEKVGKRLITEVLCWHENATHGIRVAYNGTSRTTV
ncbi:hypothetical protein RclHR1_05340010 [Rhizophagus clarus]|uniref:Uncharacterized protein n=1 Tax=Rhizophagus clarus TaxID=94130 RepID=A0A2Z6RMZ8_9GLOM|nr:hypothetical protein RclHR1_05340010 [Rhizophagus clarus]